MTGNVVFVDTETTGLDPTYHEIWEVGLIDSEGVEDRWFLPVNLARAETVALNIGGFHDRHPDGHRYPFGPFAPDAEDTTRPQQFARDFARYTWGKHLVGAVVSFDAERLARLLRRNGQTPGWHYHLVDVEALAAGWVLGRDDGGERTAVPPWDSNALSLAVGVNPEDFDRHTALGDCRWAKAIYDTVAGRWAA